MATNEKPLSFGRYLKNIRLERGISLKEISNETRIGTENLLLIEKEDHDRLPADVFVKGFIRAYAKAVGADSDKAVQLYLSSCHFFQETANFEADLIMSGTKFWARLLLSLGALLCIVTLSVLMTSVSQDRPPIVDSTQPETATENMHTVTTAAPPKKETLLRHPPAAAPERLLLEILTVEKTWMKVIIDDTSSKEYSLNPGDRLELESFSGFNLLIGNAAGVKLTLNKKPLNVPGKSGQVVSIKIP